MTRDKSALMPAPQPDTEHVFFKGYNNLASFELAPHSLSPTSVVSHIVSALNKQDYWGQVDLTGLALLVLSVFALKQV